MIFCLYMFKKILVVYSDKKTKNHLETVEKVRKILKNKGTNFVFVKFDDLRENDFDDVDMVISLGGDGTFVRAGNFVKNQLIFGINSDPETSEGALVSLFSNDVEKLNDIIDGKYKTMIRERARVVLNEKEIRELVVNAVFVGAASQFHCSRYVVDFKGHKEEHRSSGILVSTGSGSTGWFKSAGGEIFKHDEKKLKFIIREPYNGDRLYRPELVSGEIADGESIEIISTRDYGGVVAVDDSVYEVKKGDSIKVSLSDFPLRVVQNI